MKALISSTEIVHKYDGSVLGHRVAQVEPDHAIFEVAESLSWKDCADDVVADQWYFDPNDNQIKSVPVESANT
jgi:hypothetical protein